MVISLLIMQVVDTLLTIVAIDRGAVEKNPVINWFMEKVGKWWWVIKLPALPLVLYLGYINAHLILFLLNVLYAAVIIHNIKELRKL